jgi:hypothetical protein
MILIRNIKVLLLGQGVQILFHHIVEAFGTEAVSLRKTLKQGELPKAAMGTAECVYWDNKKYG